MTERHATSDLNAYVLPCSFGQERLWVLHQLEPASPAFNMCAAVRLDGCLDVKALQRALDALVARHETLRTSLLRIGGVLQQVVAADCAGCPFEVVDLGGLAGEAEVERLVREEAGRPFDLGTGPLLRVRLLRLGPADHVLLVTLHHIVADGWSVGVLLTEVSALYGAFRQGRASPLPELAVQYADFAVWQRERLAGAELERLLGFWRGELDAVPWSLALPGDRARPPVQSYRGGFVRFEVPEDVSRGIKRLARAEGATPYMVLLAVFEVLLFRYSGQGDFTVGTPVANRSRAEVEGLIGFFVNMVVLRAQVSREQSFRELVGRTRRRVLDALDHQELPFEKLVEALQPERDVSRTPLFQAMFVLENALEYERPLGDDLTMRVVEIPSGTAKYDLTLAMEESAAGFVGSLEFSSDLFDAETAERMAGHLRVLLGSVAADPDAAVGELELLPAGERRRLAEWNDTAAAFPAGRLVPELFAEQAARTPDAVAVVFGDERVSYRELDERSARLAGVLARLGVGPDVVAGVCLERSVAMVVAVLGVLRAGGAYVPLDPGHPAGRLAFVVGDCGAVVVVTQQALAGRFPAGEGLRVVRLDAGGLLLDAAAPGVPAVPAGPGHLAYVMYTSGSTGVPKGVMIEHRNLANYMTALDRRFGTDPLVWLAVTPISFDISVTELLWPLTRGSKVVIHGEFFWSRPHLAPVRPVAFSLFYFAARSERPGLRSPYHLLLEGARFADRHGFAAVWTPERHFHDFGGIYPDPTVTSAAVAAVTDRVAIRAGSLVAPLHHPVRIAEGWSVVDNLSGGRIGISFASGWHADDFVFAPGRYAERRATIRDDVEIVRRLWRGEPATFENGVGAQVDVRIHPRPVQEELPVWITAAGSQETFRLAGELGANVLTHLLGQTVSELAVKLAVYREARAAAGHDPECTPSWTLPPTPPRRPHADRWHGTWRPPSNSCPARWGRR